MKTLISPRQFVRLGWEYSQDRRIVALVNMEAEKEVNLPQPPLPVYIPKKKDRWSMAAIRAFAHGMLP